MRGRLGVGRGAGRRQLKPALSAPLPATHRHAHQAQAQGGHLQPLAQLALGQQARHGLRAAGDSTGSAGARAVTGGDEGRRRRRWRRCTCGSADRVPLLVIALRLAGRTAEAQLIVRWLGLATDNPGALGVEFGPAVTRQGTNSQCKACMEPWLRCAGALCRHARAADARRCPAPLPWSAIRSVHMLVGKKS